MSDPNNPNIQNRTTPQWGLMQRELFWAPNEGKHPPFNTREYRPQLVMKSPGAQAHISEQIPTN